MYLQKSYLCIFSSSPTAFSTCPNSYTWIFFHLSSTFKLLIYSRFFFSLMKFQQWPGSPSTTSTLLFPRYTSSGRHDLWPKESEPIVDCSREFQAAIPTGHECSRLWQTGMIRVARQHVPNHQAAKILWYNTRSHLKKTPSLDSVCLFFPAQPFDTPHVSSIPCRLTVKLHITLKWGNNVFLIITVTNTEVKTLQKKPRRLLSVSVIVWLVKRTNWQR